MELWCLPTTAENTFRIDLTGSGTIITEVYLGIIQVLRLFKEGGVGQAKYNSWIMIGGVGVGGTKNMMDNAFTNGIDRKFQSTPNQGG